MPLINIPGPGEKLRTNYALNQPPDPTLAPEIVPVVVVDDFSDPSASGRDCIAFISVTAAAGNTPIIALVAQQGRMYRLKRIIAESNTADTLVMSFGFGVTGLTEQFTKQYKDMSGDNPGRPNMFIGGGNSGAITIGASRPISQQGLNAQLGFRINHDNLNILLQPQPPAGPTKWGRSLLLSTLINAQGLHVTVEWNELDLRA